MSSSAPDVIDRHLLEQICTELGPDNLCRLMTTAAADVPKRIVDLEPVLARGDHAEVERLCHSLRGTTTSLGLIAIAQRTIALETAARDQDEATAQNAYGDLRSASETTRHAIEEWVREKSQVHGT